MCNPAFIAIGFSALGGAIGGSTQAKVQQQSLLQDANNADRQAIQSENQAQVADNNAKLAEYQAQDALLKGTEEEARIKIAGADLKGRQKVALAANGVDITTGSANDILTSTDIQTQIDANTARDNALRSAWGYRTQGTSYTDSAATARADAALYKEDAAAMRKQSGKISPSKAAFASLLGSAGQVASTWYNTRGGR